MTPFDEGFLPRANQQLQQIGIWHGIRSPELRAAAELRR